MTDSRALSSNTEKLPELLDDLIAGAISHERLGPNRGPHWECDGCNERRSAIESLFAALQSENERLKETAITPEEAKHTLEELIRRPHKGVDFDTAYDRHQIVLGKLRRISEGAR